MVHTTFERFEALGIDELRAAGSSKWVTYPDTIGSFIAESDFGTAPSVREAIRRRLDAEVLGYSTKDEKNEVGRALAGWSRDRFGWDIDPSWVGVLPEVLTSLEIAIDHFTPPGSAVIVPTPSYMPFFTLPGDHGREVIEVPLLAGAEGHWSLDYDRINAAFAAGAGLLVLSNPSNPTGTVFGRHELLPLVDIVDRHGGRVWADEIHATIVFDGRVHVPYASLSDAAAAHTLTATSASKGWNTAGLKCSQMVFSNQEDVRVWRRICRWPSHTTGYLGLFATIAAYNDGRVWLDDLVAHLAPKRLLLADLVSEHLPLAELSWPEATYLAWLDLRRYRLGEGTGTFFRRNAGVAGTDGALCGRDFGGFVRLNFATPDGVIHETVRRLGAAVSASANLFERCSNGPESARR